MNNEITFPNNVPLRYDDSGTIRVNGSRVRLNTLIWAFKQGDMPAEIADCFPSVSIEEINAVIDWYLTHQSEAEQYFEWYDIEAEKVRQEIESQPGYAEWREELRRRRAQLQLSKT